MLGPDHLPGREARVVDRERPGVAHDVQREVAAHDEPAVQRGHPAQRRALAQPGEQGISLRSGQGLDGDCDLLVIGGGVMGMFTAMTRAARQPGGRAGARATGRPGDRVLRPDQVLPARLPRRRLPAWRTRRSAVDRIRDGDRHGRAGALRLHEHRQAAVTPDLGSTYATLSTDVMTRLGMPSESADVTT